MVSIFLGRQPKINPKTGLVEQKQCKTTQICATPKDAIALQIKHNVIKQRQKVSTIARKASFKNALADYNQMYSGNWGASYLAQKKNQRKRMLTYFGETDIRKIDTLDIEKFFRWCQEANKSEPESERC